jgi:hypothetical protein
MTKLSLSQPVVLYTRGLGLASGELPGGRGPADLGRGTPLSVVSFLADFGTPGREAGVVGAAPAPAAVAPAAPAPAPAPGEDAAPGRVGVDARGLGAARSCMGLPSTAVRTGICRDDGVRRRPVVRRSSGLALPPSMVAPDRVPEDAFLLEPFGDGEPLDEAAAAAAGGGSRLSARALGNTMRRSSTERDGESTSTAAGFCLGGASALWSPAPASSAATEPSSSSESVKWCPLVVGTDSAAASP